MKRCIVHWTGGTHKASELDRKHYHFLIEGDGTVITGKWPVLANVTPKGSAYAAHTRGANTGSGGVSMCCMAGATESPFRAGKWPMTRAQWDRMIITVADLCRKYDIAVTPSTVLTHAEVEKTLGIKQAGKWDITRIAFDPSKIGAKACGDYLRAGVSAAIIPVAKPVAAPQKPARPVPAPRPVSDTPKLDFTPVTAPKPLSWGARMKAWLQRFK